MSNRSKKAVAERSPAATDKGNGGKETRWSKRRRRRRRSTRSPKLEIERETETTSRNGDRKRSWGRIEVGRSSIGGRIVAAIVALMVLNVLRGIGVISFIVEWLPGVMP